MKIVAMIPVYNGGDIIQEVIEHLLSQGLEIVILDNGSTDESYNICKEYEVKGKVMLRQFKTSTFNFPQILRILYDMALTLNPDWIVRSDQDEILESGKPNLTLKEAIEQEDKKGTNLIQFDVFEFFMTDNDKNEKLVRKRFPYYSWQHDNAYRAWKFVPGTKLEEGGGHYPVFPIGEKYKLPSEKFVIRHYRFRNRDQAIRNNVERIERVKNIPERKIGWYTHFDKIAKQKFFESIDHKLLHKYDENNKWSFEIKYRPHVLTNHPKREDIFSPDGDFLIQHSSIHELYGIIKDKKEEISRMKFEYQQLKDYIKNVETQEDEISKPERPFLLVTGMHRSGTSFLARALNLEGVYLGKLESLYSHEWMVAPHNKKGNWENSKFLKLAEETLKINGGSWHNPPKKISISNSFGEEIKNSVNELRFRSPRIAGFKDPRILLYMDAWKEFLPNNILIMGIFRHPLKVAESLKKRNQFDYQKSLDLWKFYNQNLLNYLEKYDGFLLNFDWPEDQLLNEIKKISHNIGLESNSNISEWYTTELLTSDITTDMNYAIPNNVTEIYDKLKERSQNNDKVNIQKISYSSKELQEIIKELYSELQEQGNYLKKLNQKKMEIVKNENFSEPLTELLAIYYSRNDLRQIFPEVEKGDYSRLLDWAKKICLGAIDSDKERIIKYSDHFISS